MERVRSNVRAVHATFILVRECDGTKQSLPAGLDESRIVCVLEKPFDLDELERLACKFEASSTR